LKKWIIRTTLGCAAVILATTAALLFLRWLHPEPQAMGRPLTAWLVQLRDRSPEKREEARLAVLSLGPEAIPYLTAQLTQPPNAFQRAARGAFQYAPESLKGPLGRIYRPRDEVVNKHMALHAIGLLGTNAAAAVPVLGEILRQDAGLVSAAANALIQLGTNSLPELIAVLDDGDYNTRAHACYALAVLGKDAAPAVPRLGQIIEDERGPIANTAMTTLARIGEPAVPLFSSFLSHTNAMVRQLAATGLANVKSPAASAVPALIKASSDPSAGVRAPAVSALASIDRTSPESAGVLLRAFEDPSIEVRLAAANAARVRPRLVRENREQFRKLLDDEAVGVRVAAALAVGQTGQHGEWAIPQLQKILGETNPDEQRNIRYALQTITNSLELARGGPLMPPSVPKPGSDRGIEVRD
jgi:HEAT repeat protein